MKLLVYIGIGVIWLLLIVLYLYFLVIIRSSVLFIFFGNEYLVYLLGKLVVVKNYLILCILIFFVLD